MKGFRAERFHWGDDSVLDLYDSDYQEGEHPRGVGGKWSEKGGLDPYKRWAQAHPKAGGDLLQRLQQEGGFTYHVMSGNSPKTGYVVSPYKAHERVLNVSTLTPMDLAHYVVDHQDLLSKPDHYFGSWHNKDDGKVYLDVAVVTDDAEKAEQLSRENAQLAYFDLGKMETVNVRSH
jgi:hypothetical protein